MLDVHLSWKETIMPAYIDLRVKFHEIQFENNTEVNIIRYN